MPATALLPERAQIRMKELVSSANNVPSKTEHFHPTAADTQRREAWQHEGNLKLVTGALQEFSLLPHRKRHVQAAPALATCGQRQEKGNDGRKNGLTQS